MKERNEKKTLTKIGMPLITLVIMLSFFAFIVWIIFQGFLIIEAKINQTNFGTVATLITALISLFGTLLVAYISYQSALKSKRVDKEKEIEQELRKQKAPSYENFVGFLFEMHLADFKITSENPSYPILFAMEDILFAIRADMGHLNKGLKRGDLLALYINDVHTIIDCNNLESAELIVKNIHEKNKILLSTLN